MNVLHVAVRRFDIAVCFNFHFCCSIRAGRYCGHGAGERWLPRELVATRWAGPRVGLLMGCSSGNLRREGLYEPSGAALMYLCAGLDAVR